MRASVAWSAALAVWVGGIGVARAAPCVGVAPDAGVPEGARGRFVEQLGASLAQHGIAMCGASEQPVAEVSFESNDRAVAITVRDTITRKAVTRSIQLSSVPRDGRPLALAVAADELLRATWAEILLTHAPAPPPEAPREVRAIVEASIDRPASPGAAPLASPPRAAVTAPERGADHAQSTGSSSPAFSVAAALAAEHASGGLSLAGADAEVQAWLGSRFAVTVRVGGRLVPSATASDGSASATALLGGIGVLVGLVPDERRLSLAIPVRLDGERIQFEAHPTAGARGSDDAAFTATAVTGLRASLRFAPGWSVDLEGTAGAVLHPVDADDGTATFTALSGAIFGASLGVRATL